MSWDKITDEKPSREFRERVFKSASAELAKLRTEDVSFIGWRRRVLVAGAFAAVAALVLRLRMPRESTVDSNQDLAMDSELMENMEMFSRLDLLEDLDILVNGGSSNG